jgi:hypothetical protein
MSGSGGCMSGSGGCMFFSGGCMFFSGGCMSFSGGCMSHRMPNFKSYDCLAGFRCVDPENSTGAFRTLAQCGASCSAPTPKSTTSPTPPTPSTSPTPAVAPKALSAPDFMWRHWEWLLVVGGAVLVGGLGATVKQRRCVCSAYVLVCSPMYVVLCM